MKAAGVVEVGQYGSPRRRPLASRRFGGGSLLEWVVRRVTEAQQLDVVAVVAGNTPQQRQLARLAPPDVVTLISAKGDPLGRVADAAQRLEADGVVRVRLGDPFVDPAVVDQLVTLAKAHPECDYIGYRFSDGRPAVLAKLGMFAEWCRTEALLLADRLARDPAERRDVTRFIYSRPDQFVIRLAPVPPQLDRDDVRLTIEREEDWDHLQAIYEALGPDRLQLPQIAGLLDQQPGLRRRMARLNRAEAAS